jgi:uncharacterized protein YbgA (DUF1722 family)/uncharacterized protein YbbK (DUF523 family)
MSDIIRVGVSACVAGEKVRYDGSDARDPYLSDTLAKYVEFVPLCPEVACGMGIPREKVRQVDCGGEIRLIGYESGEDWTERMNVWADKVLSGLQEEGLCGFVFRSTSPSCALMHGKLYSTTGLAPKRMAGFFARKLMDRFPMLPTEADDRLHSPMLRENFIRRVFVLKRWNEMLAKGRQIGHLVDFHTRHKMLIRAHDLRGYRELGHLLGRCSMCTMDDTFETYGSVLFRSLELKATPKKNADVLMHALGFFKQELDGHDRQELLDMISAYKEGRIPLLMPVTLLNHYAHKYGKAYLTQQFFLNPDPAELKLLNHV